MHGYNSDIVEYGNFSEKIKRGDALIPHVHTANFLHLVNMYYISMVIINVQVHEKSKRAVDLLTGRPCRKVQDVKQALHWLEFLLCFIGFSEISSKFPHTLILLNDNDWSEDERQARALVTAMGVLLAQAKKTFPVSITILEDTFTWYRWGKVW